jgi:hypothetical protein
MIANEGEDVDGDDHLKFQTQTLSMLKNIQDKGSIFELHGSFVTRSDDPSKDSESLRKTVFCYISYFYITHRIIYIAHDICISPEFHHYLFS